MHKKKKITIFLFEKEKKQYLCTMVKQPTRLHNHQYTGAIWI